MLTKEVIERFDEMVARGFCKGVGSRETTVCVEAAICYALGLAHGDDPECVEPAVRSYKIKLNDSNWSSPEARAKGLRDLGIAQIGSRGVVDGIEFSRIMTRKTIQFVIPGLFREVLGKYPDCLAAADRCEAEGTADAARAAADAAYAADAADAGSDLDKYLLLSATLALETLRELKSPGCEWLDK